MLVLLVLCLFAVMVFIIVVQNYRQNKAKTGHLKRLPGPVSLPIIGGVIQIGLIAARYRLHSERIQAICKKYGKTMGMQIGVQYYVCTEDFDTIKELLNSPAWMSRFPDTDLYKLHTYGKNLGLVWSSGKNWKEMRRFSTRTLKNLGSGERKLSDVFLMEELEHFITSLDEDRKLNNNEIYMRQYFQICSFNILWRVMSGYRFLYNDQNMKHLIHAVEDAGDVQIGHDLGFSFPYLRNIPFFSVNKQKQNSIEECHKFFVNIMKKRREEGHFKKIQNDYMDHFLLKVEEEKDDPNTLYTDEQFISTCVDLIFAGVDTSGNSLQFAILYMLIYPEVQNKVRQEIHSVVGKSRPPSMNDRINMPYTEATMLELFRHANVVPGNTQQYKTHCRAVTSVLPRAANQDTIVHGCFVPKDTLVGLNFAAVHMSEEIWGDPKSFRPERFLDPNNKLIDENKLLAFGGGKRGCLGQSMTKSIWLVFFSRLMQRYTFERSPAHPKLSTVPISGIASTTQPFHCLVNEIQD